jgi:DNA processing protein
MEREGDMGESTLYWLAFSHVPGVGFVRISRLLDGFGDLEHAWRADRSALRRAGMGPKTIDSIMRVRSYLDLGKVQDTLDRLGIRLITFLSPQYPESLAQIQGPPACLFIRGDLKHADINSVAVVGTRRASPYGAAMTAQITEELAVAGLTIISGLARGIDGIAHKAALDVCGRTIAILGSGIDEIYPSEHRQLASEISENGALISEYPPGTAPEGHHFPARNRIIAGLAKAVIVIEAAERSGALITAGFAAEQGKEVFALPADITRKTGEGTNRLIQDGAHPLLESSEVIEILNLRTPIQESARSSTMPEDANQLKLLEILSDEPAHIDVLCQRTGIPIQDLQAALSMLELHGSIKHLGGMHYLRLREERIQYCVD